MNRRSFLTERTPGASPRAEAAAATPPSASKFRSAGGCENTGKGQTAVKLDNRKPKEYKPRLTKQELNKLRAQGRCFDCRKEGHDTWNCPSRHTAPAPRIHSSAVNFKTLERLAYERDSIAVHACSIKEWGKRLFKKPPSKEEICEEIQSCFMEFFRGNTYTDEKGNTETRFTVMDYGEDFQVTDWTDLSISHLVKKQDLESGWDILSILDRTRSIREDLKMDKKTRAEQDAEVVFLNVARIKSAKKMSRVEEEKLENIERTAMKVKDFTRKLPKPVVAEVYINGKPAQALIDSGSLADFMSTTLADQLKLKKDVLAKPLTLQMAVQGSRSKINCSMLVDFRYQGIESKRRFDVVNLDSYDVILGTPFIYQHRVLLGLNPTQVIVGMEQPELLDGEEVATILSAAADVLEDELDKLRGQLKMEATDLCTSAEDTELPPLCAVNHTIPLIDEDKVYSWRPSHCPEALKSVWQAKKNAYLRNG